MVCYILSPRQDSQKNHTDKFKIIPGHKIIPSASISFLAISRVAIALELVASIKPRDVSVIFWGHPKWVNLFTFFKKMPAGHTKLPGGSHVVQTWSMEMPHFNLESQVVLKHLLNQFS